MSRLEDIGSLSIKIDYLIKSLENDDFTNESKEYMESLPQYLKDLSNKLLKKEKDIAIGTDDFTFDPVPKFKIGDIVKYGMQGYFVKDILVKNHEIYYTLSCKSGDIFAMEHSLS